MARNGCLKVFCLSMLMLLLVGVSAYAATIYVPDNYTTIQGAINAAHNGDTVIVRASGSPYVENIDFKGKAITVKSESGPASTVIDGNQSGSVVSFVNYEGPNSVLDGFTITNGSGTHQVNSVNGGGIYAYMNSASHAAPTIINNIITGNSVTGIGGGIYGYGFYGLIKDNIISGNTANGDGAGICLENRYISNSATIERNTISGNTSTYRGGGIYSLDQSATIEKNTITGNIANSGAGMYLIDDSSQIVNNTISQNVASGSGGGIFAEAAGTVIEDNIINQNSGTYGAGVACSGSATIRNNAITDNTASQSGGGISESVSGSISGNTITGNSAMNGGGIQDHGTSALIISDNIISGNTVTGKGAGIRCDSSSAVIDGNFISKNSATHIYVSCGGGIYCYTSSNIDIRNNLIFENTTAYDGGGIYSEVSSAIFTNNILYKNTASGKGGGIICKASPFNSKICILINNTLIENSADEGGGIVCSTATTCNVDNTILWNNSANTGPEASVGHYYYQSSVLNINYSDVTGGQSSVYVYPGSSLNWGSGMINSDPLFADTLDDDFHLTYQSPCKASGYSGVSSLPTLDFEGDPRILAPFDPVSMGADEYHRHLYYTGTSSPGMPINIKIVGEPNTSPTWLILGSGVEDPPINTQYGDLYLKFPIHPFGLGTIPSSGILKFTVTVPPLSNPGDEFPLQALVVEPQSFVYYALTNLSVVEVE